MEMRKEQFQIGKLGIAKRLKSFLLINREGFNLKYHLDRIQSLTNKLVHTYQKALETIDVNATTQQMEEAKKDFSQVRVFANLLNECLEKEYIKIENGTQTEPIEFGIIVSKKLEDLESISLKFENWVETISFTEEQKEYWDKNYLIYANSIAPELNVYSDAALLVMYFHLEYTPAQLQKLSKSINRYVPEGTTFKEDKEYEALFIKAIKEFKDELKEKKNLWDKVLDLLAGGVHPSPNERVMLQRWLDGEQKNEGKSGN